MRVRWKSLIVAASVGAAGAWAAVPDLRAAPQPPAAAVPAEADEAPRQRFFGRLLSRLGRRPAAQEPDAKASDWQLVLRVRQALHQDQELAGLNLGVTVQQAVATLDGPVGSEEQRRRAESLTQQVKGIKRVRNLLRVRPAKDRDPAPPRIRQFPPVDQPWPNEPPRPEEPVPPALAPPAPPTPPTTAAPGVLSSQPSVPGSPGPMLLPQWRPADAGAPAGPGYRGLLPSLRPPVVGEGRPAAQPRPAGRRDPLVPPEPRPSGPETKKPVADVWKPVVPGAKLVRPVEAQATAPVPAGEFRLFNLERLLRANPRFARVKYDLSSDRICLYGTVETEADLSDLRQALVELPGGGEIDTKQVGVLPRTIEPL
jgi:hypothetical protein